MKIVAVILFALALLDILKTWATIIQYKHLPSRIFRIIRWKEIITIGIQIVGDLLLIIFLIWWWR